MYRRNCATVIKLGVLADEIFINEIRDSWHDYIVISNPDDWNIDDEQYDIFAKIGPKNRRNPGFKRKGFLHTEYDRDVNVGFSFNRCTPEKEKRSPGLPSMFSLCPRSVRAENHCTSEIVKCIHCIH